MATQNRNLYDEQQINALRREYGVPVTETMDAAIEEVKDSVVQVATNVAEGATSVVSFVERGGVYFIAGWLCGVAFTLLYSYLH